MGGRKRKGGVLIAHLQQQSLYYQMLQELLPSCALGSSCLRNCCTMLFFGHTAWKCWQLLQDFQGWLQGRWGRARRKKNVEVGKTQQTETWPDSRRDQTTRVPVWLITVTSIAAVPWAPPHHTHKTKWNLYLLHHAQSLAALGFVKKSKPQEAVKCSWPASLHRVQLPESNCHDRMENSLFHISLFHSLQIWTVFFSLAAPKPLPVSWEIPSSPFGVFNVPQVFLHSRLSSAKLYNICGSVDHHWSA